MWRKFIYFYLLFSLKKCARERKKTAAAAAAFDKMIYTFTGNQVLLLKFKFKMNLLFFLSSTLNVSFSYASRRNRIINFLFSLSLSLSSRVINVKIYWSCWIGWQIVLSGCKSIACERNNLFFILVYIDLFLFLN